MRVGRKRISRMLIFNVASILDNKLKAEIPEGQ
jgi:hypothetical protein